MLKIDYIVPSFSRLRLYYVDMLVHYGSPGAAELWKSTSGQIQDGGWRPEFQYSNRYNSAANCLISLIPGTEFDHVAVDKLQIFKITASKVKVTAWCNLSAVKCYKIGTDKLTVKFVEIPERSATRDTCSRSKGQRSRSHGKCPHRQSIRTI